LARSIVVVVVFSSDVLVTTSLTSSPPVHPATAITASTIVDPIQVAARRFER
jgi:hypothetical protein